MKATGVIRKVDELGRIVIPKELRDVLGIQIKSPLEIFVEADKIILQNINLTMLAKSQVMFQGRILH